MFMLSEAELEQARDALIFHGLDSFFPKFAEFDHVVNNWQQIAEHIQKIDLDTYEPYKHHRTYVAKTDKLVRPIDRLHVQDLLIYTAITLILRDCIEESRLPQSAKKSFSYRSKKHPGRLYETTNSYEKYRKATEERLSLKKTKFVATTDITDFFPRVYQHRLENAIESFLNTEREREANRVLCKKLLPRFSNGTSYGIPTGPFASRILAEALLVDVDATLSDKGIDFVRWLDDITIFTKTDEEAVQAIQLFMEWLDKHHGLSINQAKTKIYRDDTFIRDIWKTYDEEHERLRGLITKVRSEDPYADDEDFEDDDWDLDDDNVEDAELIEIFDLALTIDQLPKYGLIRHLLERVIFRETVTNGVRKQIIEKAMDHVWQLEPVFDSIAKAIAREHSISDTEVSKFCKLIFRGLEKRTIFAPGHTYIWLCWLIAERKLTHLKTKIKGLISESNDSAVKEFAILSLRSVGDRADLIAIKDDLPALTPNTRIALIIASSKLGKDERNFWRKTQTITDVYERLAFSI